MPPARNTAGSIAAASATKNRAPICQAQFASNPWVTRGTISVPSDPPADTMPRVVLRRCSGTARATAVIASEEAVQDRATPTNAPETNSAGTPPAAAMIPSPTT